MKKDLAIIFLSVVIVILAAYIFYISFVGRDESPVIAEQQFVNNINNTQILTGTTKEADIFAAFAVTGNEPDFEYLKSLLVKNNFFKNFKEYISSAGINKTEENDLYDGLIFSDINGDNYNDIWINDPLGGTPRMGAFFTLVSNPEKRSYQKGPKLFDVATYDKETKELTVADYASCFGECAWEEIYQWLGSNLILVKSTSWEEDWATGQAEMKNYKENYKLDNGVEAIPLNIRKIVEYAFSGEKLKYERGNENGAGFANLDLSDHSSFKSFTLGKFNDGYDLYYDTKEPVGGEIFSSGFFTVSKSGQVIESAP